MEQENLDDIRKKADKFESQYNKLKQEFKDYNEFSRKNEEEKPLQITFLTKSIWKGLRHERR